MSSYIDNCISELTHFDLKYCVLLGKSEFKKKILNIFACIHVLLFF